MPKKLDPQEGGPLGGEGLDPSPRALEARHTQIDVAPLLEDMGSFRIPDRCSPDRAPPRRAALRSARFAIHTTRRWGSRTLGTCSSGEKRYRATRSDQPATPRHPRTHYSPSARQLQLHAQAAHGGWWVIRYTHFAWCIFSAVTLSFLPLLL